MMIRCFGPNVRPVCEYLSVLDLYWPSGRKINDEACVEYLENNFYSGFYLVIDSKGLVGHFTNPISNESIIEGSDLISKPINYIYIYDKEE